MLVLVALSLTAVPVGVSVGATGPSSVSLTVQIKRDDVSVRKNLYAQIDPRWTVNDADFNQHLCYGVHATFGKLTPRAGFGLYGDSPKSFRSNVPPFPFAPIGGSWAWACLINKDVFPRDPRIAYLYEVELGWEKAGPATIRAYVFGQEDHRVRAETEQFVRLPAQPAAASKPGTKPPTTKPGAKPGTKPGTKPPTGNKSSRRLAFTARVSGKPVVGGDRLFVSYQGSQGKAEGTFTTATPVRAETDIVEASGAATLVHDYTAFPDERYTLGLTARSNSLTKTFGNGRVVRLGVKVTSSTFSGCPVGKTGDIVVSDLTNGDGFEVDLCGTRLVWIDGKGADVAVTIRGA